MDTGRGTLSLLYGFSRGVRRFFVAAIAASVFSILFSFLTPQIIRFTVDYVIGGDAGSLPGFVLETAAALGGREALAANLIFCAGSVLLCALLSGVFSYWSRMGVAKGTEGLIRNLRIGLFRHIQYLPFAWHSANQTGDIVQRCTSDVETIRNFIATQLIEVIRTILLIAVALWLMFSMNVTLALVSLAFIPVIVLYSALFHRRISRQFQQADEAEGDLMTAAQENFTGVRVVRSFGREAYEREIFRKKNDIFTNKWLDMGYTLGLFWGVGDLATGCQLLAVVCTGAWLAATGSLSLGELIAFISYTQYLSGPVRSLGRTLSELSKAGVSAHRLGEILRSEPESDPPGALCPPLDGDIQFDHVSFRYGTQQVLRDLDFTIHKGETFGILGATGSGKSTLASLLTRLYELPGDWGAIRINGTDIRDMDRAWLRRHVGLVLQEPFLFSTTIRENIAVAEDGADLEKIRESARIADIDEDILGFREGYDTVVGERGVTLSGGQKQRIAIARTLMLDCPILIFDDSLSAVDTETDERIRAALARRTRGNTVILISHRINTLMRCDRILVLEEGRMADLGTHRELIARPGAYQRVYALQSDAALLREAGDHLG